MFAVMKVFWKRRLVEMLFEEGTQCRDRSGDEDDVHIDPRVSLAKNNAWEEWSRTRSTL